MVFDPLVIPNEDHLDEKFGSVNSAVEGKYSPLNPASKPGAVEDSANYDEISVDKWKVGGNPKEKYFEKTVKQFADRLTYLHPERRYFVVTDYEPSLHGKKGWDQNWHYGTIQVREGLNGGLGSGFAFEIEPSVLHVGQIVENPELVRSFILSLGFQQKIELMQRALAPQSSISSSIQDLILDSVLAELAMEQEALRLNRYREGLTRAQIGEKLVKLHLFVETFKLGLSSIDSPLAQVLLQMDGKLRYLLETQVSFWDNFADFFSHQRLNPKASQESEALLNDLEAGLFDSSVGKKATAAVIKAKYSQYKEQIKSLISRNKKSGVHVNKGEVVLGQMKEILTGVSGLSGTFEEYQQTVQRILTLSEYNEWKKTVPNP